MAGQLVAPILKKPIPPHVTHEGIEFGPFNLSEHIHCLDPSSGELYFRVVLPEGLRCSKSGVITGKAAVGTAGEHQIMVSAENDSGIPLEVPFTLSIKPALIPDDPYLLSSLKQEIWEALGEGKRFAMPTLSEVLNRPISAAEVYYLLQRYGSLTIWDVYNLEPPDKMVALSLPDCSSHYEIFDRGSCIVVAPKSLYSHARTLEDALQSARVAAREVYKRGWTIEFAGFSKMVRAAWVELQHLGDKYKKSLEILHYLPSTDDKRIYTVESKARGMGFEPR